MFKVEFSSSKIDRKFCMKTSRFAENQIIGILKQAEAENPFRSCAADMGERRRARAARQDERARDGKHQAQEGVRRRATQARGGARGT